MFSDMELRDAKQKLFQMYRIHPGGFIKIEIRDQYLQVFLKQIEYASQLLQTFNKIPITYVEG